MFKGDAVNVYLGLKLCLFSEPAHSKMRGFVCPVDNRRPVRSGNDAKRCLITYAGSLANLDMPDPLHMGRPTRAINGLRHWEAPLLFSTRAEKSLFHMVHGIAAHRQRVRASMIAGWCDAAGSHISRSLCRISGWRYKDQTSTARNM